MFWFVAYLGLDWIDEKRDPSKKWSEWSHPGSNGFSPFWLDWPVSTYTPNTYSVERRSCIVRNSRRLSRGVFTFGQRTKALFGEEKGQGGRRSDNEKLGTGGEFRNFLFFLSFLISYLVLFFLSWSCFFFFFFFHRLWEYVMLVWSSSRLVVYFS